MVHHLPSESSSFPTLGLHFLPLTEVELGNPSIKHCGVRRLKGSLHHISIILSTDKGHLFTLVESNYVLLPLFLVSFSR